MVFDCDVDGWILKIEFGIVFCFFGDDFSDLEFDELMVKVDGDGDGFIDL